MIVKNDDSYIWKDICDLRKTLKEGLCFQIMNGQQMKALKDTSNMLGYKTILIHL